MEREQLTTLVLAAQQGDNKAISALFNAFQNTVYNIALRETKDPETAADVVQESFIEVIAPELPLSVRSDFGLFFSDGEGNVVLFLRYSGSQSGEINVEKVTAGGTTQWYITSYHSDILDSLVITHFEYNRPFNDGDFNEW